MYQFYVSRRYIEDILLYLITKISYIFARSYLKTIFKFKFVVLHLLVLYQFMFVILSNQLSVTIIMPMKYLVSHWTKERTLF